MKPQEIELWARSVADLVVSGQPVEDARVELKAIWPEPSKAAHRLAAHANASRGDEILWLVGVDERNHYLVNTDEKELGDWFRATESFFDGYAPRLLGDVRVNIDCNTIVALLFETVTEAPYVVNNVKTGGGYPEYVVPWREGTRLRAARRVELLEILVSKARFAALLSELQFNAIVAKDADGPAVKECWGCLFRTEEFHRSLRDGAVTTLPLEVNNSILHAYVAMGRANQRVSGALFTSMGGSPGIRKQQDAKNSVIACHEAINEAYESLQAYLRS